MSYAKAASFQTAYLTAYVALVPRGNLQAGETLLVHGATGGVGLAAVDLGKVLGATVIATGGTDEKLAVVKARGADHVINYTLPDGRLGGFRDRVKELTDGRGADVVYDPVGGDVFDESMRCVNWNARLLTIGFTSGRWPQAAVNLILIKSLSVIGVRAGEYGRREPEKGVAGAQGAVRPGRSGSHRSVHLRRVSPRGRRWRDEDADRPQSGRQGRRHDERLRRGRPMTHRWHCRCGKLAGEVDVNTAVNRGICYCKDCQAFAYFLGAPERILDAQGGTDIVQTSPQALTFTAGREHLACMGLTPHGLMRWYAACCNTAIGNTARTIGCRSSG